MFQLDDFENCGRGLRHTLTNRTTAILSEDSSTHPTIYSRQVSNYEKTLTKISQGI